MTTGGTPAVETVSGRSIPRYQGKPTRHRLRYSSACDPSYRGGGLRAVCDAGDFTVTIDGQRPWQDLAKLNRQHSTGKP